MIGKNRYFFVMLIVESCGGAKQAHPLTQTRFLGDLDPLMKDGIWKTSTGLITRRIELRQI